MKLRNKKTVVIGELHYAPDKEYHFTVATEDPSGVMIYKTLGEVIKDWADFVVHVPAEPLIKDEKIRKAVRAWADANGIKDIVCYATENGFKFAGNPISLEIRFNQMLEIDTDGIYTIAELCGEGENEERL